MTSSATPPSTTLPNGGGNRDGLDDNRSQNCGVEGETDDPTVLARRMVVAKSILATLFLSQGVPMIEMGDELWRTEGGNNNPYCQDSELTWVDWHMDARAHSMADFVRTLTRIRRKAPRASAPGTFCVASDCPTRSERTSPGSGRTAWR